VHLEVQFLLFVTMLFSRKTENSSVGRVDVMFISGSFFLVNFVIVFVGDIPIAQGWAVLEHRSSIE
jgi:hypothetical protein